MKRMIGLRKQFQVFGRGTIEFLPAENRKILAYLRRYKDDEILCVANLSRSVQPVELDLSRFKGRTPVEMLFLTEFPTIGELPYFLTLPGYFSYWFRLQQSPSPISARVPHEAAPVREAPALFMGVAWDTLLDGNVRTLIERDLLIPFLQRQRWFGGKARRVRSARFIDWGAAAARRPAALRHHRRRQLRGWRAGQLFPAAGDLRGRRRARRRRAFSATRCWRG